MNTFAFVALLFFAEVAIVALAYFIGHSVGMVERIAPTRSGHNSRSTAGTTKKQGIIGL